MHSSSTFGLVRPSSGLNSTVGKVESIKFAILRSGAVDKVGITISDLKIGVIISVVKLGVISAVKLDLIVVTFVSELSLDISGTFSTDSSLISEHTDNLSISSEDNVDSVGKLD